MFTEGIGDLTAFPFVNPEGVESLGLGLEGVRSRRPCAAPHSDTVEAKTLLRAPHHPGLGAHGDACGGLSPGVPPRSVPVSSLAQHSRLDNSIWRARELIGRAHTGREMETQ